MRSVNAEISFRYYVWTNIKSGNVKVNMVGHTHVPLEELNRAVSNLLMQLGCVVETVNSDINFKSPTTQKPNRRQ